MDLAVTLVKSVMRAFYETREILVMDALILHETLRDDDLAYLMAINTKDLHKICGKLREERLLKVYTRAELRDGNPRPSNRTWYFIDYRQTIDAIKWRVYTIDKEVQGSTVPANEKKEYFCPVCHSEWTAMEVLDNSAPEGFLCHRCQAVLEIATERNASGHEQSTRLNDQFKFISELLPKIDSVHIPECDFERALAKARPVIRDITHQRAATVAVDTGNRPMAVKGLANLGPQSIAVNISAGNGPSEAEREAERAKKELAAKQNALPQWMSQSTVTGESFGGGSESKTADSKAVEDPNKLASNGNVDSTASAQIDDIFEKLKAEQLAERAREIAEDDEDDESDDGEDEFEDVQATGATSSADNPTTADKVAPDDGLEERLAKRPKADHDTVHKVDIKAEASDDEDEEDMEFEDI